MTKILIIMMIILRILFLNIGTQVAVTIIIRIIVMTKILSYYHIEYLEDCHFDYWDTSCCHDHHQDYLDDQDPDYHDDYLEDAFDEDYVGVVIGELE